MIYHLIVISKKSLTAFKRNNNRENKNSNFNLNRKGDKCEFFAKLSAKESGGGQTE